MAESLVMLAEEYTPRINPVGYLLSEKLDGWRAVWNGKNFVSRKGGVIGCPDWFKTGMPPNAKLDGEIWGGRGTHVSDLTSITSDAKDPRWRKLQYMVFDIPDPKFGPIERRLLFAEKLIAKLQIEHVKYVPHTVCQGKEHLDKLFMLLAQNNAEGLMMVRPGTPYTFTRTTNMLKLKVFHEAEAEVFGYKPGTKGSKFDGYTGALWCRSIESSGLISPKVGTEFKVGTGLPEIGKVSRKNPPAIGSIITYQFSSLTVSGKPFHPSFKTIRKDI